MWRKSKEKYNYKSGKTLSLLQKIVVLITLVVCIALLPTSLFTTQKVARVIYDRVSINAVSINNILCNSPEIRESLEKQNKRPEDSVDSFMAAFVNDVDHSDEAGVAIYDKNRHLRVLYNPGKLPDFEHSARIWLTNTRDATIFPIRKTTRFPIRLLALLKMTIKNHRLRCYWLFR